MQQILSELIKCAPFIKQLFPYDCALVITDEEKFIYVSQGEKVVIPDNVGQSVDPGTPLYETQKQNKKMVITVEREDITFRSVSIPIRDEHGKVIGCLGIPYNIEKFMIINEAAKSITISSEEVKITSEKIEESASQLIEIIDTLKISSNNMIDNLDQSDNILKFITSVATNTNLLGLNAAIEAARAGEYGRGFSVVADEIRKMSEDSKKSVTEIKIILERIKSDINNIDKMMAKASNMSSHQSESTHEITEAIANLNKLAENLEEVSADF